MYRQCFPVSVVKSFSRTGRKLTKTCILMIIEGFWHEKMITIKYFTILPSPRPLPAYREAVFDSPMLWCHWATHPSMGALRIHFIVSLLHTNTGSTHVAPDHHFQITIVDLLWLNNTHAIQESLVVDVICIKMNKIQVEYLTQDLKGQQIHADNVHKGFLIVQHHRSCSPSCNPWTGHTSEKLRLQLKPPPALFLFGLSGHWSCCAARTHACAAL